MKHLEPLMTHLSPFLTAVVFIPETSEPASGSVRQKDANSGASASRPRYSFFSFSEAARMTRALPSPLQEGAVPIPEKPQELSSSMMQPPSVESPAPPYS